MPSTVRFARVVETCGQPQVHTLWVEPVKDPELQRAQDARRVMTVHRPRGKAEFGTIGYEPAEEQNDQYLLFPKSLRRFEGARVVGVKFDLIEQPKLAALPANVWTAPPRASAAKRKTPLPAPIPFPRSAPIEPSAAEEETIASAPLRRPRKTAKRSTTTTPQSEKADEKTEPRIKTGLAREVRAALKELEHGKTVAAYRRLERALDRE